MPLPKFARPYGCTDCVLNDKAFGFVPPSGPAAAPILFIGEAAGFQEAFSGSPFVGAAGSMLERILKRSHLSRDHVRIHNTCACNPPGDWLDGAPWAHSALASCRQYLDPVLAEPHQVIVTLGAIPLKQILDLWGLEGIRVQDFHGTVHQRVDSTGRVSWVVPTFHPSFLQRGAIQLLDVVRFDVGVAAGLVQRGGGPGAWTPRPVSRLLDLPPYAFAAWASGYLQRLAQDPEGIWLAVDIETQDKEGGRDEGELTADDTATTIDRVNLAYSPDEGITIPYEGPYTSLVEEVLQKAGIILMWNKGYDEPRLRLAGHRQIGREVWDLMWAAHHLQSDLPLGLGFWAPFYSDLGAWKHLGKQKEKAPEYGCDDGIQTVRIGHGLVKDLVEAGMWEAFYRHTHLREQFVLRPAHDIGLLVDRPALDTFHGKLQTHAAGKLQRISTYEAAGNLKPKLGYRKKPVGDPPISIIGNYVKKGDQAKAAYMREGTQLVEREVEVEVLVCARCGDVAKVNHRCPDQLKQAIRKRKNQSVRHRESTKKAERQTAILSESTNEGERQIEGPIDVLAVPTPADTLVLRRVRQTRWFWQLPFNPESSQQLLRLIHDTGESPGRAKKTRKPTTNKETLQRLSRKTGNPIYSDILDYKAIKKVDSTYAMGFAKRIWADGRFHPQWTGRPSMMRDSYVSPNCQNVVTDRGGVTSLAAGFRECIVAAPECWLVEVDYSGIEGIETGWLSGDPDYIRLAYLGIHAYLTSFLIDRPASLSWSDDDLALYFKEIKKSHPAEYDKAKRVVHGNNYGLTIFGMLENFPEVYKDLKDARRVQDIYYAVAPKLPAFHALMRDRAYQLGRLGGPPSDDYHQLTTSGQHHPYAYRHWFWGVQSFQPINEKEYRSAVLLSKRRGEDKPRNIVLLNHRPFKVVLGEDSKRAIAFYPQSIAAGRLKEAELDLFHPDSPDFIGNRYYGQTPLRAPIHDALLMEVPKRETDYVIEQSVSVMRRPEYRQPCPPEWGIGDFLQIGVSVKIGRDWMHMEEVQIPTMLPETARERLFLPVDVEQYEDDQELGVRLN